MYDELYGAWKREKLHPELQPLHEDFYSQASAYIKKLKESQRMIDDKTLKARLLRNEIENAKKLVSELLDLRFKKMMVAAEQDIRMPANCLTKEDKTIYSTEIEVAKIFDKMKRCITEGRIFDATVRIEQAKTRTILLRFIQEMPAVIGTDMKTYGPFKVEDVAILPIENAEALIRQGVAVRIDVGEK